MDRSRSKSKKNVKSNAGETGKSSSTEAKGTMVREEKRRRVAEVSAGFDTSQEKDGFSLQMQPLTDSPSSGLGDVLSSPLGRYLTPGADSGALDALDGWSLGSNLYFSDTGSGFLGSRESSGEEEKRGATVPPVRAGSGRPKRAKSITLSPTALLRSAEKYRLMSSQELFELESLLAFDEASQSSLRTLESQDGGVVKGEEEIILGSVPAKKTKKTAKSSEASQSSLRTLDCKSQDGGVVEGEEMDSAPAAKKTKRTVKSTTKKTDKAGSAASHVVDALAPKAGLVEAQSSQESSGTDLFAESENLTFSSVSQSSLEVNVSSPVQMLSLSRRAARVNRNRGRVAKTLVLEEKKSEKSNNSEASQNSVTTKQKEDASEEKKMERESAGKTSKNADRLKKCNSRKEEKHSEKSDLKSGIGTAQSIEVLQPETRVVRKKNSATKARPICDSASQSSVEVISSPERMIPVAKDAGRLKRKKDIVAPEIQEMQDENRDDNSSKTNQNFGKSKSRDCDTRGEKKVDEESENRNSNSSAKTSEKKVGDSAGQTSKNSDTKQSDDDANPKCRKTKAVTSGVKASQHRSVRALVLADMSKRFDNAKPETYPKKRNVQQSHIITFKNVDVSKPQTNPKKSSLTKFRESVAKGCSNAGGPKFVAEFSSDDERLNPAGQPHVPGTVRKDKMLPTPSSRLSLRRAGTAGTPQKNEEKSVVGSESSAAVEDAGSRDDSRCNVGREMTGGDNGSGSSLSAVKKSRVEKNRAEIKRRSGSTSEEAAVAFAVCPGQHPLGSSGESRPTEKILADDGRADKADDTPVDDGRAEKTDDTPVDDGRADKADDDKSAETGRTRSPSLFEYESDSVIIPPALAILARKPKTSKEDHADKKRLDRSEQGKTLSAERSRPGSRPHDSTISWINAQRTSGDRSTSSKSLLTDSGVVATPASFTLASRPGLAKLTTSTPLEQYRSFVGLDKPKSVVKKAKRKRDSGNGSDFVLDSNISMLSPVWPVPPVRAQGRGRGQPSEGDTASKTKKARVGKVSRDFATLSVSETRPVKVPSGERGSKRKKTEVLPSSDKTPTNNDALEATPTAAPIAGPANVRTEAGQPKKRPENRDAAAAREAKVRQLYNEERFLQELDDIDQNYSLIIDE